MEKLTLNEMIYKTISKKEETDIMNDNVKQDVKIDDLLTEIVPLKNEINYLKRKMHIIDNLLGTMV